ncbi:YfbU family protein [Paenibacillus pinistramenti]|uniref:YfbU family protein n=1 Tax=Paenibacillus pinistramenti TaxID=1768003 RepID=UPI00110875FF|nr:YfbU family protein [Paenibacillus pinistramenti]
MLTKLERLILSNQLQILKALNLGDGEYYDEKIKILQRGYAHYYDQVMDMVSDDIPQQISDEVFLILNMFRTLSLSFDDLSGAGKAGIERESVIFRGFSRHLEFQHFSFASYVIEDDGGYGDFDKPEGCDSGAPMLPAYRSMLRQWALMGHKQTLSPDEIRFIAKPAFSIRFLEKWDRHSVNH